MYYLRLHVSAVLTIFQCKKIGEVLSLLHASLEGKRCSILFNEFNFDGTRLNSLIVGVETLEDLTEINRSFGAHNHLWADVTDRDNSNGLMLLASLSPDNELTYVTLDELKLEMEVELEEDRKQEELKRVLKGLRSILVCKKEESLPQQLLANICSTIIRAEQTIGRHVTSIETHKFDITDPELSRQMYRDVGKQLARVDIIPACRELFIQLSEVPWADNVSQEQILGLQSAFDPEALIHAQ